MLWCMVLGMLVFLICIYLILLLLCKTNNLKKFKGPNSPYKADVYNSTNYKTLPHLINDPAYSFDEYTKDETTIQNIFKQLEPPYAYGNCTFIPGTNCPQGAVFAGITKDNCSGADSKTLCQKKSDIISSDRIASIGVCGAVAGDCEEIYSGYSSYGVRRCPLTLNKSFDGRQNVCWFK